MGNESGYENISMFDKQEEFSASMSQKLEVVKLNYDYAERMTWEELFTGYDTLKAITFSSGINFVYRLLDMFASSEIIFGCEEVLSYSLQEIMAYQGKLIEKLNKQSGTAKDKLLGRISDGTLHLYVARNQLSHEKIYLLSARDGRKRVIMGSANMSYNAFGGRQRENICYIDGDAAYDWYLDNFESLKSESSDEISRKALVSANLKENIDELPISETVHVKKAVVIEPVTENKETVEFVLDVRNEAIKLKPNLPKLEKSGSKIYLAPEHIHKIRKHVESEAIREKEQRAVYPHLVVDADKAEVRLNDELLNLNPSAEEVKNDVDLFLRYMDGYSQFHGDNIGMQYRYYEFANWFFCSPFMAVMRDYAARYDQNRLPYPVFGLLYGQSKAGKTSFLETLLKMMIGQKPKISAPDFTRSAIDGLKHEVEGAPIIVDDLTNTRFNQHAIETIKNDDFGVSEHLTNYPAVVISANEDVKAVAPEVIRRTVICRVEAGLTNTEVMKSNVVRIVQQKIGTAFYREYLRRMLELIPGIIDVLKDDESEVCPDILQTSAQVIVDIISENSETVPEYIRPLSLENYFSEQVTGKYAIKTIRNAWATSRKSFNINKAVNELRYNAGATYEADRLMKELPETLEAHKSREWIVMKLDAAREFFGIQFKKGFWG